MAKAFYGLYNSTVSPETLANTYWEDQGRHSYSSFQPAGKLNDTWQNPNVGKTFGYRDVPLMGYMQEQFNILPQKARDKILQQAGNDGYLFFGTMKRATPLTPQEALVRQSIGALNANPYGSIVDQMERYKNYLQPQDSTSEGEDVPVEDMPGRQYLRPGEVDNFVNNARKVGFTDDEISQLVQWDERHGMTVPLGAIEHAQSFGKGEVLFSNALMAATGAAIAAGAGAGYAGMQGGAGGGAGVGASSTGGGAGSVWEAGLGGLGQGGTSTGFLEAIPTLEGGAWSNAGFGANIGTGGWSGTGFGLADSGGFTNWLKEKAPDVLKRLVSNQGKGGMAGGGLGDLLGYYQQYRQGQDLDRLAQKVKEVSDPFSAQRGEYQKQLGQFWKDALEGKNVDRATRQAAEKGMLGIGDKSVADADFYGDMLKGYYKDPKTFKMNPMYQTMQREALNAAERGAAARGMNTSGNIINELNDIAAAQAGKAWSDESNRLGGFSMGNRQIGNQAYSGAGYLGNQGFGTDLGFLSNAAGVNAGNPAAAGQAVWNLGMLGNQARNDAIAGAGNQLIGGGGGGGGNPWLNAGLNWLGNNAGDWMKSWFGGGK